MKFKIGETYSYGNKELIFKVIQTDKIDFLMQRRIVGIILRDSVFGKKGNKIDFSLKSYVATASKIENKKNNHPLTNIFK